MNGTESGNKKWTVGRNLSNNLLTRAVWMTCCPVFLPQFPCRQRDRASEM